MWRVVRRLGCLVFRILVVFFGGYGSFFLSWFRLILFSRRVLISCFRLLVEILFRFFVGKFYLDIFKVFKFFMFVFMIMADGRLEGKF